MCWNILPKKCHSAAAHNKLVPLLELEARIILSLKVLPIILTQL